MTAALGRQLLAGGTACPSRPALAGFPGAAEGLPDRGEAAGVRRGPPGAVPGARRDRLAGPVPRRSCPGRRRHRVRDGPVHCCGLGEFFVGQVADCDHEVAVVPDVADVAGPQPGHRQVVAGGGGDGAGIDRRRRMGAGEAAGTVLTRRHSAAARCERAEWRCTRTAPAAPRGLTGGPESPGHRESAAGRYGGGRLRSGGE